MNEETKQKIIDFNNQFGIRTEFITGESTLGYALGNTIYINTSINQDYEKTNKHELLHFFEGTPEFEKVKKDILEKNAEELPNIRKEYELRYWGIYSKEEINNFLSVTSIKCKYKDSSNKLQDKEIKFIPSSNKLFIKDVTASSGYEIGDYVDKVLISKENSDKIIDIKLKLSKNKQIYETKFTIDIINFKGEDI